MDRIDLHIHTTASDGILDLKEVVKKAKKIGLKAIAISDHDTINPDLTDRIQIIDDVEVVTDTEIKCHYEGIRMEMHGYFVDPKDNKLGE
ncbi:MAG: PHP domain-containing protein, partial [Candidatus Aenigmatarchaeota archaeon]